MQQRGDARLRQVGEFGEGCAEQLDIAREQRTQDQTGGQLAGRAQMRDEAAHLLAARARGDVNGRALARFAGDTISPIGGEPVAGDHELRQGLRQLCHQRHAGRGRQAFQHQHRLPDRGKMAVPFDDTVP